MSDKEITDYDIEQGEIIYNFYKEMMPEMIPKIEYMVKMLGWQGTLFFMDLNSAGIPKEISDLNTTFLKYLDNKFRKDAKNQ